jgi:hypothetical protein
MKISKKTTRLQLAALITQTLGKENMSAVLVGGAVVSIYTNNKYESYDLDFISPDDHAKIEKVLARLGFKKTGKSFEHPETALFVEFPNGPIAIGKKIPVNPEGKIKSGKTTVTLLSPTQCVMDRLSAWYHWNDTESLEQAVLVSQSQPIKIEEIRKWSAGEGEIEKFERYLALSTDSSS